MAFHLCLDVLGGVSVGVGSLDRREVSPLRPPPDRAGASAETDRHPVSPRCSCTEGGACIGHGQVREIVNLVSL